MPRWSDYIETAPPVAEQTPAPVQTAPAPTGGKWSRYIEPVAPTYHRDRLAAAEQQDRDAQLSRHYSPTLTAEDWDQLRTNAEAEANGFGSMGEQHQADLKAQAAYQRAHPPGPTPEGTPQIGPDNRTLWGKTKDLTQATGMGARTGVYNTAAGIDTALNALGVVPDQVNQNMHELANESARASDLGGPQGVLATGADLVTGTAGYFNPALAPVIAYGQGRRDVLQATSQDGTLASGDHLKADLVGIASGLGAVAAGPAGRLVEGTVARGAFPKAAENITRVARPHEVPPAPSLIQRLERSQQGMGPGDRAAPNMAPVAESLTAGTAFMAPQPIATAVVAGQDQALQDQARAGIEGLPANVGGMAAAGLGLRAVGRIGATGRQERAQQAAVDREQQIIDQEQARTQALESLDPNYQRPVPRQPEPQLWSDIQLQAERERAAQPDQVVARQEQEAADLAQQPDPVELAQAQKERDAFQQQQAAQQDLARRRQEEQVQADAEASRLQDEQRTAEREQAREEVQQLTGRLAAFEREAANNPAPNPLERARAQHEIEQQRAALDDMRAELEAQRAPQEDRAKSTKAADIIDVIREAGGINPPTSGNTAEIDAWNGLPAAVKRMVTGGKQSATIDKMANQLAATHGFGDGTTNQLLTHIVEAMKERRRAASAQAAVKPRPLSAEESYQQGVEVGARDAKATEPRPADTSAERQVAESLRRRLADARKRLEASEAVQVREKQAREEATTAARVNEATRANEERARRLAEEENPNEVSNAPRLREDQGQADGQGNVSKGREVPRGQDLQRQPSEGRGTSNEPLRPTEGQAPAREVGQGSHRPAIERLAPHAVAVRSVADLHRGLREVYGLSHDEATVATALVRAHAASKGVDPDVFTRSRISEVRRGKGNPLLNQRGQAVTTLDQQAHGTRLDAPGKSLAFQHLKRNWEKAHGERLQPQSETWQQLVERARAIDAQRGNTLYQGLNDAPAGKGSEKGAVSFAADGRAVLHALKNPDVSTAVHELFHIFRRTLDGRDADIAAHWAGAKRQKDGTWSWGRAAEERLARAGERYVREGVAPTKALQGVFDKLKTWLSTIYHSIEGTPINQQISPEMRGVFERMFTPAKGHEAAINEHNLKGPRDTARSDATGAVPSPDRPAATPVPAVRAEAILGDSRQAEPKPAPVQGQAVDRQPAAQPAAKAEAPKGQETSEPTTGNSNAMSAETRKRLGLPDRETPEGRTFDEMYEAGKKKAEADPNAIPALVEELRRDPERIIRSDAESGMLLKHKVDLENDLARLRKAADDAHAAGDLNGELEARVNLASQRKAMVEFTELMERAGTAAGRALVARKMMSTMDHSLSHMEAEAAAAKGAPLTDVEAKKVDILFQSIEKANAAAQKRAQAKLDELEGKMKARDFSKPYKPPAMVRDAETIRLQTELEGAKRRYREMVTAFEKANRSRLRKIGDFVGNLPGQAKSLKASLDNSAVFRQGWRVMFTNPIIWQRNALRTFVDAFKVLGGKHVMDAIHAELKASPYYEQARRAKLAIIAPEEDFPVSLPARIPLLGRVFKASEEAYTGFQYRNRMQAFERMMKVAERSGIDTNDTRQLRSIGRLINSLTSRGDLGKLEPVGNILNNVFFSARKIKADFDFLTTHAADTQMTAFARKHALFNLIKVVSGTAMILAIANAALPGSVETDPRSAAFGKIKVGNTRYDVTGGVSPILTLAARLFTGSTKSATTGKVRSLNDGQFGSQTRADVIGSFFGNKLSPTASVVMDHLRGRTFEGKPPTLSSDAWNLLVPMAVGNYVELQQDTGATPASITAGVLADFMGIGTNTYDGKKPPAPHPSK